MLRITGTAQTVQVSGSLGGRRGLSCLEFKNGGWLFGYLQLQREFPDGGKIQREQEGGPLVLPVQFLSLDPDF